MRRRRLFLTKKPASADGGPQLGLVASREWLGPGIESFALRVSWWDVGTFDVEVRRFETITPVQCPKSELPELVAFLSRDSAPCPLREFGGFLPGPCYDSISASENPHHFHETQPTLPN